MTDDIEEIRKKKMEEMKRKAQDEQQEELEKRQEEAEMKKEAVLKECLTSDARKRLNTVEMAKPEFAEKVEQQIVALSQSGRLQDKISEEEMKEILKEMDKEINGRNNFDIKGAGTR